VTPVRVATNALFAEAPLVHAAAVHATAVSAVAHSAFVAVRTARMESLSQRVLALLTTYGKT
jgi:hypothetical protein